MVVLCLHCSSILPLFCLPGYFGATTGLSICAMCGSGTYSSVIGASACLMLAGASSLIEMIYHRQLNEALGSVLNFAGMALDTHDPLTWIVAAAVLLSGAVVFEWVRKRFVLEWELIQTELAQQLAREESA